MVSLTNHRPNHCEQADGDAFVAFDGNLRGDVSGENYSGK